MLTVIANDFDSVGHVTGKSYIIHIQAYIKRTYIQNKWRKKLSDSHKMYINKISFNWTNSSILHCKNITIDNIEISLLLKMKVS